MTRFLDDHGFIACVTVCACAVAWCAFVLLALQGCGAADKLTVEDHALTWTESAQDVQCVRDNRGDAGAMGACRAAVKRDWDAYWLAHFADGGSK